MSIYNITATTGKMGFIEWGNQLRDNMVNTTDDIHNQYLFPARMQTELWCSHDGDGSGSLQIKEIIPGESLTNKELIFEDTNCGAAFDFCIARLMFCRSIDDTVDLSVKTKIAITGTLTCNIYSKVTGTLGSTTGSDILITNASWDSTTLDSNVDTDALTNVNNPWIICELFMKTAGVGAGESIALQARDFKAVRSVA